MSRSRPFYESLPAHRALVPGMLLSRGKTLTLQHPPHNHPLLACCC
jgi:hypothetical protein